MASLYKSRDERVQDLLTAFTNIEGSVRYSLTQGGKRLPFDTLERALMREDKAWAMARLVIDKIMRLPNINYYL